MGITSWSEYRETLGLTKEDEAHIRLEKELITAFVTAREKAGVTQRQLASLSGLKQPVIARLEKAVHSPKLCRRGSGRAAALPARGRAKVANGHLPYRPARAFRTVCPDRVVAGLRHANLY